MPVEHPHPNITAPTNPDERVWRYMDFAKFVSLIAQRELYFCNLEVLAKADPHEGLLSHPNYRHREWNNIADLTSEEYKIIIFDETRLNTEESKRVQFESTRNSREYWCRRRLYDRRTLFVNCWHLNSYESAAMWMQYADGGHGIAITSSYENIIEALADAKERLFVGLVKYLDWNSGPVDNTVLFPYSKRRSFDYEKELRIVYWDLDIQEPINALCQKLSNHTMDHLYRRITTPIDWTMIENEVAKVKYEQGRYITVKLDTLIRDIYVAPTSPDWFLEVIEEVCKKFSVARKPKRSDLLSSPIR
jgi:hypothetical protein